MTDGEFNSALLRSCPISCKNSTWHYPATQYQTSLDGINRHAGNVCGDVKLKKINVLRPFIRGISLPNENVRNERMVNALGMIVEVVDTDWPNITLTQFNVLIVVENQDCFYHLALFDYSQCDFRSPLIIYRGDRTYSKGAVALKHCWLKTGKAMIYFGDFDPKGVSIAMNEGYHSMLLPSPAVVIKKSSSAMFPDAQLKFLPELLRGKVHSHFRDYLLILEKHQALRQQKMQGEILKMVLLQASD